MKKVAIEIRHMQELFNGEFGPVIEFVKLADEMGVDQVSIADHVVVHADAPSRYPGPEFPPFEHPWYEPVSILSGLATVTKRIRLSMGVMISPLRPAILLAKQLATLDVLSGGRLDAGFGVGWQHEEYDAEGLSFEGRFARMEEQVYACRALWSQWPASYSGKTVQFENLYSAPQPLKNNIPVWLGLRGVSDIAASRMARCADGWIRTDANPQKLGQDIARLREVFVLHGRKPDELTVRAQVTHVLNKDGTPDIPGTLARAPAYAEADADILEFFPGRLCRKADELEPLLRQIVALKKNL
jgi:probable F420-dependent oxidoreductase